MSTTVGDPKPRTRPAPATERPAPSADRPLDAAPLVGVEADRLYRLSVEQYHRMAEAGILTRDDKVELIEGLLVRKMTIHDRHIWTLFFLDEAFRRVLPGGWFLYKENPIALERSEPEPDVAILRAHSATISAASLARPMSRSSLRSPSGATPTTAASGRSTPRPASRSAGSPTSTPTGSRSTPTRPARTLPPTTGIAATTRWASRSPWSSTAARSPAWRSPT